jgi:hypothetical protein
VCVQQLSLTTAPLGRNTRRRNRVQQPVHGSLTLVPMALPRSHCVFDGLRLVYMLQQHLSLSLWPK